MSGYQKYIDMLSTNKIIIIIVVVVILLFIFFRLRKNKLEHMSPDSTDPLTEFSTANFDGKKMFGLKTEIKQDNGAIKRGIYYLSLTPTSGCHKNCFVNNAILVPSSLFNIELTNAKRKLGENISACIVTKNKSCVELDNKTKEECDAKQSEFSKSCEEDNKLQLSHLFVITPSKTTEGKINIKSANNKKYMLNNSPYVDLYIDSKCSVPKQTMSLCVDGRINEPGKNRVDIGIQFDQNTKEMKLYYDDPICVGSEIASNKLFVGYSLSVCDNNPTLALFNESSPNVLSFSLEPIN